MNTPTFDELASAAYKGERATARRLAVRQHLSEVQALQQVLTVAAGQAGLAALCAARAALRQRELDQNAARRAARDAEKDQQRAQRGARRQAALPSAQAWRGWFDGSAHPNPGRIGIGALLCGPAGERVEISRCCGYGNSGEAEYLALTALLQAATEAGARDLLLHGDSQVVINDVNLGVEALAAGRGAKGLEGYRARVMALLAQLGDVRVTWVPRHRNAEADRLSQAAAAGSPPTQNP